ncbi:MAG TPA: hypothetical protein VMR95_00230 [Candidatus Binatia bacterium]|nr:hypothetical protein [Candidatus Binatia bacterium]
MTWNYRIIRHDFKKRTYLAVHEVFYDESGKITSWTADPIDLTGSNKAKIVSLLNMITADIKTPILSETKLIKTTKELEAEEVTQKLNEVYDSEASELDPALAKLQGKSWIKNNPW